MLARRVAGQRSDRRHRRHALRHHRPHLRQPVGGKGRPRRASAMAIASTRRHRHPLVAALPAAAPRKQLPLLLGRTLGDVLLGEQDGVGPRRRARQAAAGASAAGESARRSPGAAPARAVGVEPGHRRLQGRARSAGRRSAAHPATGSTAVTAHRSRWRRARRRRVYSSAQAGDDQRHQEGDQQRQRQAQHSAAIDGGSVSAARAALGDHHQDVDRPHQVFHAA